MFIVERFAAARVERGYDDDIRPLVLAGHEFQVGAQHTESLIDDVTAASLDNNGLDSMGFLTEYSFLFLASSGISPMNGTDTLSRSFLPRIRVFMFSRIKMMTTGISSPKANASIKIFLRTGDVGTMLPCGEVMMRVL